MVPRCREAPITATARGAKNVFKALAAAIFSRSSNCNEGFRCQPRRELLVDFTRLHVSLGPESRIPEHLKHLEI